MARHECGKCGGSGKFALYILNGNPVSNTGTTCWTCNGTGWVGKKTQKQLKEQLASPEFTALVAEKVAEAMASIDAYAQAKGITRRETLALSLAQDSQRSADFIAKWGDKMTEAPDSRLVFEMARRQAIALYQAELAA